MGRRSRIQSPSDVVLIHSWEGIQVDGIILESSVLVMDELSLIVKTMAVHRQSFGNLDIGPVDFEKYLVMSGSLVVHGSGNHAQALLKLRNVLQARKLS
ncbi:MAG: hypothetical protein M0T81_05875 [Thermoplasmatales archaeon]|nr:hypothetical protein [Thermoplasmatales archaeon]